MSDLYEIQPDNNFNGIEVVIYAVLYSNFIALAEGCRGMINIAIA